MFFIMKWVYIIFVPIQRYEVESVSVIQIE